jgi:prolyl oligopeptidase
MDQSLGAVANALISGAVFDLVRHRLQPRRWCHLVALALLAFATAGRGVAQVSRIAPPPPAPVRAATDTYFGRTVVDPYRWMEDLSNAEVQSWIKGQGEYARKVLDALPERAALASRVAALSGAGELVPSAQLAGGSLFFLKRRPGEEVPKLYVRDRSGGQERILVDPTRQASGAQHAAIDYFTPSFDGRYVAYGSSVGGSENSVLRVIETATGRELPDRIDRAQFGGVAWQPDGRAFFFTRLQTLPPGAPPTERYRNVRAYLHTLGRDPAQDVLILGPGSTASVPMSEDEFPIIVTAVGSDHAVAVIVGGVRREARVLAAPRAAVTGTAAPWQRVAEVADSVTALDIRGDTVYLLTHLGAPRFKILKTSLARPNLATAATVVAEGTAILRDLRVAQDALYVQEYDGGFGYLRRVPFAGGGASAASGERVPLPNPGTLTLAAASPGQPGVIVSLEGWTQSPRFYAYDPSRRRLTDTGIARPHPADVSQLVAEEVQVRAPDGVMVPLSIVHRRDMALDATHPVFLEGYGAYGISSDPDFNPRRFAWLERGGVYAVAHVRGGGENGEAWYRAGKGATKPNTWRDLLACAQYLVDRRYTSPSRLAVSGTSAGGILAGRAITERPDLFGAAVIYVGVSNALRMENEEAGPANIEEFGTVKDSLGARALYEMDAYQHVRDGTPYPAVLLTTGLNDPRVAPWQPAKMAARLQAATSSGRPVLLRVDSDAGHGFGSTRTQRDAETADAYAFLLATLRPPVP